MVQTTNPSPASETPDDALQSGAHPARLGERLFATRRGTEALVDGLRAEDQNLQSMPEVSPAKWHRAHTSWFFETFVLEPYLDGYRIFHPDFPELFNSYYNGVGRQHPRPQRALLSRPDTEQVAAYRAHVDAGLARLLDDADACLRARLDPLLELGIAHEQQHQELILTDLKHAFSFNPLSPTLGEPPTDRPARSAAAEWCRFEAGPVDIGTDGGGFCFDNETPRHRVWMNQDWELASRPVCNAEFQEFIADGGYAEPLLWLSDGWAWVQREGIEAPLYWQRGEDGWRERTLAGWRAPDPAAPVCHISFYEAAAFAEWAGARLPSEAEWETAAARQAVAGQFADCRRFHPEPVAVQATAPAGLFGGVWEWTASSYAPYPGFRPIAGAIGEYNGKFMANQMVLRGGSCATPAGHVRATYRNFFYPPDRWQFSGLRLARDA